MRFEVDAPGPWIAGIGLVLIVAAACDFDAFLDTPRVKWLVALVGRTNTRLWFGFVGVVALAIGLGLAFSPVD